MRRAFAPALILVACLASPTLASADERARGSALPAEPSVDDKMLAPVPQARVNVRTWEEALNHLRARSTDLRTALQEVTRAEGLSRVALGGALPTINGVAAYTHNLITNDGAQFLGIAPTGPIVRPVQIPFPDFATGSVVFNQPALALRAWYAIGTASVGEDVARLSLEDAKRVIALAAANSIVAVVTAERIAELNRNGLQSALVRLRLTETKKTAGSVTGLDVVRARQDVEAARALLITGDEYRPQAREALGLALGIPEQVGVPPSVKLAGIEASAKNVCKPARTIDERPDVLALRTKAEVARRNVNDVKYQFAPTVDLRSSANTTTLNTGAAPNTTWNVQAVLTVPIWDGGVRYGNMRANQALELQALEQLEATRRKATIQLTQARRGVSVAEQSKDVAEQTRTLADNVDKLTRVSFSEGRGTSLELVAAAKALRDAEITFALREFDLVKARILAVLALASCQY